MKHLWSQCTTGVKLCQLARLYAPCEFSEAAAAAAADVDIVLFCIVVAVLLLGVVLVVFAIVHFML